MVLFRGIMKTILKPDSIHTKGENILRNSKKLPLEMFLEKVPIRLALLLLLDILVYYIKP